MKPVVIVSAVRTPIGSFQGMYADLSGIELGAIAIRGALSRINLDPTEVNELILGNVLTGGAGQAPARQAALKAGLPVSVECMTINKVCGSGLKAVMLGVQAIATGDAEVVIAGGMESMTNSPYVLDKARAGYRMGHGQILDTMLHDGLLNPYTGEHMGVLAELCADTCKINREAQDEFTIRSYQLALDSIQTGKFKNEIVPVEMKDKKGQVTLLDTDEEPARVKFEKIPQLKPVFKKDGSVTAANASSINDGAAALILMSEEKAASLGVKPLARIVSQASAAKAPEWFTTAPVDVIPKALKKVSASLESVDLFEINEAFAVVTLAAKNELNIPLEKINVNGGSVALGHPIGASGARILVTLVHALHTHNKKRGMAAICIGGGEASAVLIDRI
ncbi:MAG: thiolase family protein [Bacteroidetes bacterium]|nr:thiolase family protein [Bacteroidota bacterium]